MRFLPSSHDPSILDGAARAEPTTTHPQEQAVPMHHPHKQSVTASQCIEPSCSSPLCYLAQPTHDKTAHLGAEHELFNIGPSWSGLSKMNEPAAVTCRSQGAKTGCQTSGHNNLLPITLPDRLGFCVAQVSLLFSTEIECQPEDGYHRSPWGHCQDDPLRHSSKLIFYA